MTTLAPSILLPSISKPRLHALVQTISGRLCLVILFSGLMAATRVHAWWQTGLFLALTSLFPQRRKLILTLAALTWIFLFPPLAVDLANQNFLTHLVQRHGAERWIRGWPLAVAAVWLFGIAYVWLVRRFPNSPIGRRPLTGLLALLIALLLLQRNLNGIAWCTVATLAMVLGQYIWFFGYSVSECRSRDSSVPLVQPAFWRPFWGINKCPMGKGAAYLERIEARDDAQLATVQLKGLRLLLWALTLSVLRVLLSNILYGPHGESVSKIPGWQPAGLIPTYAMAIQAQVAGHPYPWAFRWLALISQFLFGIMAITIWGHKIIAICRMAGFNAFRLTYRPLTSTSISEFFNRIHYYLKEMLAIFFFYPTYLRYFRSYPRLRLFTATLAAAGLGNFLYHFLHYESDIFEMGLSHALATYHTYAIYCLILGIAIGISQLRRMGKKRPAPTRVRKARATAGVLLFYCFITIFDETRRDLTIVDYATYFLNLFRP